MTSRLRALIWTNSWSLLAHVSIDVWSTYNICLHSMFCLILSIKMRRYFAMAWDSDQQIICLTFYVPHCQENIPHWDVCCVSIEFYDGWTKMKKNKKTKRTYRVNYIEKYFLRVFAYRANSFIVKSVLTLVIKIM